MSWTNWRNEPSRLWIYRPTIRSLLLELWWELFGYPEHIEEGLKRHEGMSPAQYMDAVREGRRCPRIDTWNLGDVSDNQRD